MAVRPVFGGLDDLRAILATRSVVCEYRREVRPDKTANRLYSDEHRLDERERFLVEPSRRSAERLLVPWITSHVPEGSSLVDIGGRVGTYASLIARARRIEA